MEIQLDDMRGIAQVVFVALLFLGGSFIAVMGLFHAADAKRMDITVHILPSAVRKLITLEVILSAGFALCMGLLLLAQLVDLN